MPSEAFLKLERHQESAYLRRELWRLQHVGTANR